MYFLYLEMEEGAKKAAAAAPPSPPPPDYAKGLSNLTGPKPDENTNGMYIDY